VKVTLMYFKNNITQEVIAELLEISQPTVSRTISDLEEVIGDELAEHVPDLAEQAEGRVLIVDGSLLPCWSWADAPELWSGKHHTTGHAHQFICDLDGDLLHISDPLPGRTHDAKAVDDAGLSALLHPSTSIGDKGYIGAGPLTPYRKPPGGELLDWQKDFNTTINKLRYVVEQVIANFKTWRITHTDYRRPRHTYPAAFKAIRALHFYKLQTDF